MSDSAIITNRLDELQQEWEEKSLEPSLRKMPESQAEFTTVSLKPIERLYTPRDLEEIDFERDINFPGMAPYTRGVHPTGYRAKPWTMRQFAGFGSA
ncbi:MAG: methylmalonyl-CoA mutase family protein, partial [Acidobacteria bacterium]|nr:methylmalonyl-CoA mutase family protein [Acidobacteriota bacterium]